MSNKYISAIIHSAGFAVFIIACAYICSPVFAFASTSHHYVCADFGAFGGSNSCTSSVVHINGSSYAADTVPVFNLPAGTWYFTATLAAGATNNYYFGSTGDASGVPTYTTSQSETSFTTSVGGGLVIGTQSGFNGFLSSICVDDDGSSCTGGGGGGTPTSTMPFAGHEASTTFQIIDNPTQDFMNGVWLFLAGMFFIIWLFKGRR